MSGRGITFSTTVLPNGLTLVGEQRSTAVSAAIGFFVQTGARDEEPLLSGVSHFLEHMMFKGTEKRSCLDITYEMGAMGAQSNAYTSEENTVYYMAVLPEYVADALELLSDMLRPSLRPDDFEMEKKVILEEIALYQDKPTHVLFETAIRKFFGSHPAGNSVLGRTEGISALTHQQMRGYFERRYTASNIVLGAAGNFSWNEFVSLAQKYCGGWPAGEAGRERRGHVPEQGRHGLSKSELLQAHFCAVAPGPSASDERRYAAELVGCVLGDSSGSRAFWGLIDKGLADVATIDCDTMDGTGIIFGYASSTPEQIDEVAEILVNIMNTPKVFTNEELEYAKTKVATRLVLQGESSLRRLMAIGNDWIYRKEYVPLDEELARIQLVDRSSVELMLELFTFAPTTFVTLLPA